jgi:hypothetical protein
VVEVGLEFGSYTVNEVDSFISVCVVLQGVIDRVVEVSITSMDGTATCK